ncbi:MAG: hypothetical protein O3A84_14680 [Proteobacteria bacterium]|nr:hypothetical protein [Pseudomonadota bacterium]
MSPDMNAVDRLDILEIRSIEAIPIAIPLKKPMRMGNDTVVTAKNVVVRVEAEDGTIGWGEATEAPTMTGETQEQILSLIQEKAIPAMTGANALNWEEVGDLLDQACEDKSNARSAVDMAIYDLAGRHHGYSINHLLGGGEARELSTMWLLGNATAEADAEEAAAVVAGGVSFLKLKVGVKSLDEDIRAAHLVRAAIGGKIDFTADANTAWTVEEAQKFIDGTRDIGFLCLEQPVDADDLDGMAALAKGPLPIAADEGLHGLDYIDAHAAKNAASGFSLKFIKLGGFTGMQKAAEICRSKGLKINLASKTGETSLAVSALLQFASLIGQPDWGLSLANGYLIDDIVTNPVTVVRGRVSVPSGPGLGVTVDPGKLDTYRIG